MQEKDRHRVREIAKLLYQSSDMAQIYQLKELLGIQIEECKNKLSSCPLEMVREYQGEIKAYRHLRDLIEKPNDFRN